MSKDEIIQEVTEYIQNAPENAGRVQVILLGDGGWILAQTWDIED